MPTVFKPIKVSGNIVVFKFDHDDYSSLGSKGYSYVTSPKKNRTYITLRRKLVSRIIVGAKDGEIVDHINGDTTDNRRSNLRKVSYFENSWNSKLRKDNFLKTRGVHIHSDGRFRARITHRKKTIEIGCFKTLEEAAAAYQEMQQKLRGEFTRR